MGARVRSLGGGGPRPPRGPEDIPDGYLRTLGTMMALIGHDYATRPPGAPAPIFRFPPKHVMVTSPWHPVIERFACNAAAVELGRKMPRDATCFLMFVALCETGYPPRECTLEDLSRPAIDVGRSSS